MSQPHIFAFAGGLNLDGITIAMKPGEATLLENFECRPTGSYRRFEGYERYDGQAQPSRATFYHVPFMAGTGAGITIGAMLAGATSGAVGQVIRVTITSGSFATHDAAGDAVVRQVSGVFVASEPLNVGGPPVAATSDFASQGSPSDDDYDDLAILVADSARTHIQKVPGDGRILGVAYFNGKAHAFRNAVGNATACMYVESPAGWTLAKSGLAPNGRYEFRVKNFAGSSATRYLYGVSGVHKGFEWTGSAWNDITTGMADDRPTHLEAFKNYLFFAFRGGSLQNSGAGTPLGWSVRTGAQEIGTGDDITGLKTTVGGVLAVYCHSSTWLFTGSSSADWALTINADDSGAFPFSIQSVPGKTLAVDARGIMPLQATQAFGDFESAAVSQRVQRLLDVRQNLLVDSLAIRAKSQYRLLYSDGVCITVTFKGSSIVGYTVLRFPTAPACAVQGVDPNGNEMLFMGTFDGWVHRTDVGMSFDGVAIDAVVRTAPDVINSPRQIKQFQNLLLQVSTPRPINLLVQALFDYELSDSDITQAIAVGATFTAAGFDLGNWDEITFDAGDERPAIAEPANRIDGVALNVSFVIYHGNEIRPAFTLESGDVIYKNRGFRR